MPKKAEVLVRIDAVAICATDLEIIYHGPPSSILGGLPFNKNFTPGHEYMGTVVALGPGVDEYKIGQRVAVVGELRGLPTSEIAARLGTNRNALYKLHHDARRKLRDGLVAAGYGAADVRGSLQPETRP